MPDPSEFDKLDRKNESHDPQPRRPESKPQAWINDLARRSTGLPADESKPAPDSRNSDPSLWRFAGLGVQFAGTVVLFALIGYAVDKKMGWSPWSLITLTLIAVIGNLYLLIKETLKQDGPPRPPPRK